MSIAYLDLVNQVLLMGQQTPITDITADNSTFGYKAQLAVNDAIQDLSVRLRLKTRMVNFTFSTIVGQRTYALPRRVIYPLYDLRDKTNNTIITPTSAFDIDTIVPNDQASISWPYSKNYYLDSYSALEDAIGDIGDFWQLDTGGASDTSNVVIQGYTFTGAYVSQVIPLTGGTPVQFQNTSFSSVESISKDITTGSLTLSDLTTGKTLAIISSNEKTSRRIVVGLNPTPASVVTLYGKGYLQEYSLVNALDVPLGMTEDYKNAIVAGAYAKFMMFDPKVSTIAMETMLRIYEREIAQLIGADMKDNTLKMMKSPSWMGAKGTYFRPLDRHSR